MKVESSTRTIVAILVVVAAAVAFWLLLLSPKRKEADELGTQVEGLQATLSQSQAAVAEGEQAKRDFPTNYKQLVVLGKAVPASDETSSLLVQVNGISSGAGVKFESIELGTENGSAATETASTSGAVTPSEAEASLLPLGASIGPAGLSVMPYDLVFNGSFFDVADFIKGIDSLVDTKNSTVGVDGRLVTLDGFTLVASASGLPQLEANFSVTTYLVPPGQGLTAGATPAGPAEVAETGEVEAPEAEETTEGTPSANVEGAQ